MLRLRALCRDDVTAPWKASDLFHARSQSTYITSSQLLETYRVRFCG
jgi:hypothetical protein